MYAGAGEAQQELRWVGCCQVRESACDLPELLATFPSSFPVDFAYGKRAWKITNGDHVTLGYCNFGKGESVARHPDLIT